VVAVSFSGLSGYQLAAAAPHLLAAYPLAYAAGFCSFVTPSGLVVREGVLFVLLNPIVGRDSALIIPLAMRAWEVLLEGSVTAAIVGRAFLHRSRTATS